MRSNFGCLLKISIVIILVCLFVLLAKLPVSPNATVSYSNLSILNEYNLWFIFTNGNSSYRLRQNLRGFLSSFLVTSTVPLSLHGITDSESKSYIQYLIQSHENNTLRPFTITYYDIHNISKHIFDLIKTMQQHFTAHPGSYYSDSAFFVSLAIHRLAISQNRCLVLDIDTRLSKKSNIGELFAILDSMPEQAVVGAVSEQTPVYRHVLHMYRAKHRKTTKFGDPLSAGGNPGINSGVLLLNLERQRQSKFYQRLLTKQSVAKLCAKYLFRGHLGDQDFYTLLSQEYPRLVYRLPCGWNRQLCLWWRHHGYQDIFDWFHKCDDRTIKIYHGNCNTPIPNS